MSTWWIDEPVLMGSSNPSDRELEQLRQAGFTLVVSPLDETEQKPTYDPERAAGLGLKRENIGVEDFHALSLDQLSPFVDLVQAEGLQGKTLVHCQGGTVRTGTAAAAYWIAKGVPFSEAVAKVRTARPGAVETEEQLAVLHTFEADRPRTRKSSREGLIRMRTPFSHRVSELRVSHLDGVASSWVRLQGLTTSLHCALGARTPASSVSPTGPARWQANGFNAR